MKDDLKERMVRRFTADDEARGPDSGGRVHDGGVLLLACVGLSPRRGCDGDNVCRAGGVRDGMMGWICYLVSRLKAAWKALEEAAERQRNYWGAEDDKCL